MCACAAALLFGCSEGSDGDRTAGPGIVRVSASGNAADGRPLGVSVYIFSSPAGQNAYVLADSIAPLNAGAVYRFPNRDLASRDYRFLFLATVSPAEIAVGTKSGAAPAPGTRWDDITVCALTDACGPDNYLAVETLTGKEVEKTDRITGKLGRAVGQPVYEFTRSSDPSAVSPADIISPYVESVLDRVYEISIEYAGVRKAVSFDPDGNAQPYGAGFAVRQTVTPTLADSLKVAVPQTDAGLAGAASGVKGGVRIMGFCMLPCSDAMTASLTFGYYDTTPKCGNTHPAGAAHDSTCYDRRSLTLAVPAAGTPGLSVLKDTYTVNRVGLPCDRVIDIPHSDPVSIDFTWN